LIENNIFRKLRHALVAGGGSNCNVWTFNYSCEQHSTGILPTYRDLDLHAKYPFGHLFEQNVIEMIGSDDHHGDNGPYNAFFRNHLTRGDGEAEILSMEDWSALGNVGYLNPFNAAFFVFEEPPIKDLFGIFNYAGIGEVGESHNACYWHYWDAATFLPTISYYYSERPVFLSSGYTWPAVGPKISYIHLTQHIPAEDRFSLNKKTYIENPTSLPSITTEGLITSDEIWFDVVNLTNDVTVAPDVALVITPGTTVNIPSGKKLAIQGTLIAQGMENSPITFQSTAGDWWGIYFDDSSSDDDCIIEYCTIKEADYAIYSWKASPDIKNCTIQNNLWGIYSYYASYKQLIENNEFIDNQYYGIILSHSSPDIISNEIHDGTSIGIRADYSSTGPFDIRNNNIYNCGSHGIYLKETAPLIVQNLIYDNNGHGVWCSDFSAPVFQQDSEEGLNVIARNLLDGVHISSDSYATLSVVVGLETPNAANSFYANGGKDVYFAYVPSPPDYVIIEIDAQKCWWGSAPPDPDRIFGEIDNDNWLNASPYEEDPLPLAKAIAQTGTKQNIRTTIATADESAIHFRDGLEYEKVGNYTEAITEYRYVVENYPESRFAVSALIHLYRCYQKTDKVADASSFIQNIASQYKAIALGGKANEFRASELVMSNEFDVALAAYAVNAEYFSESEMGKQALVETWKINFDAKKDKKAAETVMNRFMQLYPQDEFVIFMKAAIGDISVKNAPKLPKLSGENPDSTQSTEFATVQLPKEFRLVGNFPNPFNPETSIVYELPAAGEIKIEVFDIRGRLVYTLINAQIPAGTHRVRWNGVNETGQPVASGVYYYRINYASTRERRTAVRKMMLIR
jgi:outer membrane protein assembly factor BamD (BamD/ComL family)